MSNEPFFGLMIRVLDRGLSQPKPAVVAGAKRKKKKKSKRSRLKAGSAKPMTWFQRHSLELRDPRWFEKRKTILKRDGHACCYCGSGKNLHVHHIWYSNRFAAWEYPDDSLMTLCKPCHENEHGRKL